MNRRIIGFLLLIGVFLASCQQKTTEYEPVSRMKSHPNEKPTAMPKDGEVAEAPQKLLPPPPPPPPALEESVEEEIDIAFDDIGLGVDKDVDFSQEDYSKIVENAFMNPKDEPLSTFSIDVDNASYSNVRRMLNYGTMPNPNAVRIEEMVNYFTYDYPQPQGEHPFSINTEVNECPWNADHQLLHVGLQGYKVDFEQAPANNLVFLLDVSGSMNSPGKLPLVKESMEMILEELREEDRVAIVVYAGAAGLVLPSTSASDKGRIMAAIDELSAGGSTAGGAGIQLAYKVAKENFKKNGNNRVILCTDGDFNVGVSSESGLEELIEDKRKEGVFLTVLGFGTGNYQDAKMETLSNKGNGNYGYIDNLNEAKKMLVNEMGGTFLTIAKDVKVQIEFNPEYVESYRLVGYENRMLNHQDFDDDTKDAGELGAGHSVTALYEIVPKGMMESKGRNLRYQERLSKSVGDELAYVKFRYKKPDGQTSILLEQTIENANTPIEKASENFRFSAAVAAWGLLLRNSEFKGNANYETVHGLARNAMGDDAFGYRREFLDLVKLSSELADDVIEASK